MNIQRNGVVCALLSLVFTVFSARGMDDSADLFLIDKENHRCGLNNALIGRTATIKNNRIKITVAYEPRADLSDGNEQHGVFLADCDCVGFLVRPDQTLYHKYYCRFFMKKGLQVLDFLDDPISCVVGNKLKVSEDKLISTLYLIVPDFRENKHYNAGDFANLFNAYWWEILAVEKSNSSCLFNADLRKILAAEKLDSFCNSNKIEKIAFCFPSAHSDVVRKTVARTIIGSFLYMLNKDSFSLHNKPKEIVVVAFDENEFDALTEALTYCNSLRASLYTSGEVLIDSLFKEYQQSLSNSDCSAESSLSGPSSNSDCSAESSLSGPSSNSGCNAENSLFSARGMGGSAALFKIAQKDHPCGLGDKLIGRTATIVKNDIKITVAYEPDANVSDGKRHGVLLADCDCVGVLVTPDKEYYHEYYGNIFRAQNVQVPDRLDERSSCQEGGQLEVGRSKPIRTLHLMIPDFREKKHYNEDAFINLFDAYLRVIVASEQLKREYSIEKIAFCFPHASSDALRKTVARIIIGTFLYELNRDSSSLDNQLEEFVIVALEKNEFDALTEALTYYNSSEDSVHENKWTLINRLFTEYQQEKSKSGTSKAYWYQWPVWLKCTGFIGCGGLLAFAGWKLYQRGYFNAIAHWFRS